MHVVRDLLQVKWGFELVQIYFTFPTNLSKHVRLRQMFIILLSRQMTSPLAQYSRKFPHIKILRHHQSPLLVQKCQLKEPIKKATHVCAAYLLCMLVWHNNEYIGLTMEQLCHSGRSSSQPLVMGSNHGTQ